MRARSFEKAVYALASIVGRLLLFVPLLAGIVWINLSYGGIERPSEEDMMRAATAKALLDGGALVYEPGTEHELLFDCIEQMEQAPNTIALGSSRILQLRREYTGESLFFNCGVSGADIKDIMGIFYAFYKQDKLPQNMILSLEPWFLNSDMEAQAARSDEELYNEFLQLCLGIPMGYEEQEEPEPEPVPLSTLVNPVYFHQTLVDMQYEEPLVEPPMLEGDATKQVKDIKLSDGSVLYSTGFRSVDTEAAETLARQQVSPFLRVEHYEEPDKALEQLFDEFVTFARGCGVNVIFYLSPYHPLVYDYATQNNEKYTGFFLSEPWYANYARRNDIPLYGSYNPYALECGVADFFDGLHIKGDKLAQLLPSVDEINTMQAQGEAGSAWFLGRERVMPQTAQEIAERRSGIEKPHTLAIAEENTEVDGQNCYLFLRYANAEQNGLVLARYAVSVDEGVFYRYDTALREWVIDPQF